MTKQHGDFLFVEVNNEYDLFEVTYSGDKLVTWGDGFCSEKELPSGQWSIVGKVSELTEEQCRNICEKEKDGHWGWSNKDGGGLYFDTAKSAIIGTFGLLDMSGLKPETTLALRKQDSVTK